MIIHRQYVIGVEHLPHYRWSSDGGYDKNIWRVHCVGGNSYICEKLNNGYKVI
ncbi:hypothetical protein VPHD479_0056 [Vibrio phage D479]